MFVARVVNKIHNINNVYLLKSKYMRVIQSKFTKTHPCFLKRNGGGGRAGPGSAFDINILLKLKYFNGKL